MNKYTGTMIAIGIVFAIMFFVLWDKGSKKEPGGGQAGPASTGQKQPAPPSPVPSPNDPLPAPVPAPDPGRKPPVEPGPAPLPGGTAKPEPAPVPEKASFKPRSLFEADSNYSPLPSESRVEDAPWVREAGEKQGETPGYFTYTVENTSSLYRIAQDTLGDGEKWRDILSLNAEAIRDTERVARGTVLRIPGERKRASIFESVEPEKKEGIRKISDGID